MRATFEIEKITRLTTCELISMNVVCPKSFGPKGEHEDNTFARFSPAGSLQLTVQNPDLFNKFNPGQKFYVDFTLAES